MMTYCGAQADAEGGRAAASWHGPAPWGPATVAGSPDSSPEAPAAARQAGHDGSSAGFEGGSPDRRSEQGSCTAGLAYSPVLHSQGSPVATPQPFWAQSAGSKYGIVSPAAQHAERQQGSPSGWSAMFEGAPAQQPGAQEAPGDTTPHSGSHAHQRGPSEMPPACAGARQGLRRPGVTPLSLHLVQHRLNSPITAAPTLPPLASGETSPQPSSAPAHASSRAPAQPGSAAGEAQNPPFNASPSGGTSATAGQILLVFFCSAPGEACGTGANEAVMLACHGAPEPDTAVGTLHAQLAAAHARIASLEAALGAQEAAAAPAGAEAAAAQEAPDDAGQGRQLTGQPLTYDDGALCHPQLTLPVMPCIQCGSATCLRVIYPYHMRGMATTFCRACNPMLLGATR